MSSMGCRPWRPQKLATAKIAAFSNAKFNFGDWDRGVKSPKIRGGGENFEFSGVPEFEPFLQKFYRISSIWGSKYPSFPRTTFGRVPPPLAFGTF